MNGKIDFRHVVFMTTLIALTACGDGGGYVNDSSITINGTTYLHESVAPSDPDPLIEGAVSYDLTTTHVNMSKARINGVYHDFFVLVFPTTTIGSFEATDPGVTIWAAEIPNSVVFDCVTPTGGTITLTRNDAVDGGKLAGTFADLSFSDSECGRTFSGNFSVVITNVSGA